MTPEQAKQLLPVIQAFANGEQIQVLMPSSFSGTPDTWTDWTTDCGFQLGPSRYRIKPAKKQEWLNIYPDGGNYSYLTKEYADKAAGTIGLLALKLSTKKVKGCDGCSI